MQSFFSHHTRLLIAALLVPLALTTPAMAQTPDTSFPHPSAWESVSADKLVSFGGIARVQIHSGIQEATGLVINRQGDTVICAWRGFPETQAFLLKTNDRNRLSALDLGPEQTALADAWTAWCDARHPDGPQTP